MMKADKLLRCVLTLSLLAVLAFLPVAAEDAAGEIAIVVSPNVLNLGSQGTWVTVHTDFPYGAAAGAEVTLNGIPVEFTKSDDRGYLVAKFALDDVKGIVEVGPAYLELTVITSDGEVFTGLDTVEVIQVSGRR